MQARDLFAAIGAKAAAFAMESELARIAHARGDLPGRLGSTRRRSTHGSSSQDRRRARDPARARSGHGPSMDRGAGGARAGSGDLDTIRWDDHEGRLEMIRLTLLAGDPVRAHALALRAQRSFAAQSRQLHAARAGGLALAAAIAAGEVRRSTLRSGRRAAAILADGGWRDDALRLRLTVARGAIELDSIQLARRELAASSPLRRRGPVADRVETWHVRALIRLAGGDAAGAQRAARNGLRLLEDHRAGARSLRPARERLGNRRRTRPARAPDRSYQPTPRRGVRVGRDAARERSPAGAGDAAESAALRGTMTELRQVSANISRAEHGGRSTGPCSCARPASRRRSGGPSRHSAGDVQPSRARPTQTEITERLGDQVLAEFVESDGHLTAVTLDRRRLTRHDLGPLAPVAEQLEWLRFALTRLAHLHRRAPQRPAILDGARVSAEALDRRLRDCSRNALASASWSSSRPARYTTYHGRHYLRCVGARSSCHRRRRRGGRCRGRAGAGEGSYSCAGARRHAGVEIGAISSMYPGPLTLTGRAAAATAVLHALDGARIAHLACHGRFRSDSPPLLLAGAGGWPAQRL